MVRPWGVDVGERRVESSPGRKDSGEGCEVHFARPYNQLRLPFPDLSSSQMS